MQRGARACGWGGHAGCSRHSNSSGGRAGREAARAGHCQKAFARRCGCLPARRKVARGRALTVAMAHALRGVVCEVCAPRQQQHTTTATHWARCATPSGGARAPWGHRTHARFAFLVAVGALREVHFRLPCVRFERRDETWCGPAGAGALNAATKTRPVARRSRGCAARSARRPRGAQLSPQWDAWHRGGHLRGVVVTGPRSAGA